MLSRTRIKFIRATDYINLEQGSNNDDNDNNYSDQPAITCSKLTIETLEQCVKYVQS